MPLTLRLFYVSYQFITSLCAEWHNTHGKSLFIVKKNQKISTRTHTVLIYLDIFYHRDIYSCAHARNTYTQVKKIPYL